jgi:hypothetical protein
MGFVYADFIPAGTLMAGPSTPGPGWRFELLLGACAALLFAVAVLVPHLHLHLHSQMPHSVQAPHPKSS